jgi:hypothetical protein
MLPILAIAACTTPREDCINDVTRDTRVLSALVNETQGNLARGYALDRRQDVRTVRGTCQGRNENGESFFFSCDETETFSTNVPVAIDLNVEAAKLTSLRQRLAQSQAASNRGVTQCIAVHPE